MTGLIHFYDKCSCAGPLLSFIAGHGRAAMPSSASSVTRRRIANPAFWRDAFRLVMIACVHAVALGLMLWSEGGLVGKSVFLLTWGLANFFFLMLLRRPLISAALSLGLIVVTILLSRLKYDIVWMTA